MVRRRRRQRDSLVRGAEEHIERPVRVLPSVGVERGSVGGGDAPDQFCPAEEARVEEVGRDPVRFESKGAEFEGPG